MLNKSQIILQNYLYYFFIFSWKNYSHVERNRELPLTSLFIILYTPYSVYILCRYLYVTVVSFHFYGRFELWQANIRRILSHFVGWIQDYFQISSSEWAGRVVRVAGQPHSADGANSEPRWDGDPCLAGTPTPLKKMATKLVLIATRFFMSQTKLPY